MRRMLAIFAVVLLFVGCDLFGPKGPEKLGSISSGPGSYFVQSGGAAKGARALVTSGDLFRVEAGSVSAVIFYSDTGSAVQADVTHARQLSAGRLLLGVSYLGEDYAFISQADGSLASLSPIPEGWTYAREDAGSLYYISGGTLYKADLATGDAVAYSVAGDAPDASAWLKVVAGGGVMYLSPTEQWISPVTHNPEGPALRYFANPGAAVLVTSSSMPNPANDSTVLEGPDGTIYQISAYYSPELRLAVYSPSSGSAYDYVSDAGFIDVLATMPYDCTSSAQLFSSPTEKVYAGEGGLARVWVDGSGVHCAFTQIPQAFIDAGMGYFGIWDGSDGFSAGVAYHAFHELPGSYGSGYDITRYHLWAIPLSQTVAGSFARTIDLSVAGEIAVDKNIEDLVGVDSALFYSREAADGSRETMKLDLTTGETTVYSASAVSIEPVL